MKPPAKHLACHHQPSTINHSPSPTRRQFLGGAALTLLAGACASGQATKPPAPPEPHEAAHYDKLEGNAVRCGLCPRRCRVPDGSRGYCGVRENRNGRYVTLVHSHPAAINLDPIEKKPFFHVFPGARAYSLATVGCNLHCKFCQNWDISQARPEDVQTPTRTPDAIVDAALAAGAKTLAFTYNEPTVFYEYMFDCAKAAAGRGLYSVIVSNGFINDTPQRALFPYVKAIKIDLKAFTQSFYGDVCDARLNPVLATLKRVADSGVWLEIVNLLIPTLNDDPSDLQRLAAWVVKELGPDVPLHFTRFQPLYRLRNLPPTPPATLLRAREIAMKEGCHFVYTGNVPGLEGQDTFCPSCKKVLVRRYGHSVGENVIRKGRCDVCNVLIPGRWE